MDEAALSRLRAEVFGVAAMRASYDHGERHWKAVAHAGLRLAPDVPGCRPLVVYLFALFHDAMRENEWRDPEHGLRGAELSRRLHGRTNRLGDSDQELLYVACRDHTEVDRTDDPTIGVCWDADRLNLWRVGHVPGPGLLSTEPARDALLIQEAAGFHRAEHDWDELARAFLELESRT